jgi:hypothetical protein
MAIISKIELDPIIISERLEPLYGGESLDDLITKYGSGLVIEVEEKYYDDDYPTKYIYLNRRCPETNQEYKKGFS